METYKNQALILIYWLKMLDANAILKRIEENINVIRSYGVKRIGVFGSYIKGKQKPDSDIDILVEFEKGKKNFDNYMELKFFLEKILENKVDLVISESIKPELRPYILKSVKYAAGS